jgi:threonine dehydratase
MSFSFDFEDDDDIEVVGVETRDVQSTAASSAARDEHRNLPAAEIAQSHKVKDLV